MAYEHMEKYKAAANDLHRVREVQPQNKQAQVALQRCLRYIEQDTGVRYIPEVDDEPLTPATEPTTPATPATPATPVETKKPETKEVPVVIPETPDEPEEVKEEPVAGPPRDLTQLNEKVTVLKERGNLHFKKKSYKEAIKAFSEAYNLFTDANSPSQDADLTTKVTQVLTNRSLCFHHLGQQSSAATDASLVLDKFDSKNPKALFRRAHAYKSQEKWELAVRDL